MSTEENFDDLDFGMAEHSNLFSDEPSDVGDVTEDPILPEPSMEAAVATNKAGEVLTTDLEELEEKLTNACTELGCPMTDEMWNTVLSASTMYEVSEDSLRWFVLGITYSQNQKIIPLLGGIIKDIRAEVKLLQSTNSTLKSTSGDITKKMVSVKNDVLKGFDKLREDVIDKVTGISKAYSHGTEEVTPCESSNLKTDLNAINKDPQQKGKGIAPISEESHSKEVPTHIPIPEYAEDSDDPLMEARDKYLMEAGLSDEFFDEGCEDIRKDLLRDEELIELMYGDDEGAKLLILDKMVADVALLEMQ
ncbi:TPA_asm: P [Pinellia alphacytorhabdovirus 1]|nr:TPA_asm: P [Pinellia alphacytorhabdovirus 1]